MPTFRIEGADRNSGSDVAYDVEANSEAEARAEVEPHMLISSARQLVPRRNGNASRMTQEPPPAPAPAPVAAPQPEVYYYVPQEKKVRPAPTYLGLQIVSIVAMVYAVVLYLIGAIMLGISLLALMESQQSRDPFARNMGPAAMMMIAIPALGVLFGGVLAHALANGCSALRDIARNSYRL